MQLNQISVRPILKQEEPKYQDLMEAQHYLVPERKVSFLKKHHTQSTIIFSDLA